MGIALALAAIKSDGSVTEISFAVATFIVFPFRYAGLLSMLLCSSFSDWYI